MNSLSHTGKQVVTEAEWDVDASVFQSECADEI